MSEFIFLGSKASGLNALKVANEVLPGRVSKVLTFDDSADVRSCLEEIENFCFDQGLPFEVIRPKDLEIALNGFASAKVLVVGWYSILGPGLLAANEFYGLHYSPLPRYRGSAPVVWQIINAEKEIGITLFRFASGVDDGDFVGQAYFPLLDDDTINSVLQKADGLACDLLRSNLKSILDETVVLHEQDHSLATYCGMRIPEDGLINWYSGAHDIVNFVRAQSDPYPGAFTTDAEGRKIYILRAEIEEREIYSPVGAVFERSADSTVVKCGDGAVRVTAAKCGEDRALLSIFKSLKTRLGVSPR